MPGSERKLPPYEAAVERFIEMELTVDEMRIMIARWCASDPAFVEQGLDRIRNDRADQQRTNSRPSLSKDGADRG